MIQTAVEADLLEQVCGPATRVVFTADLRRNHDIFQRRERRQQLKILEDESHRLVAHPGEILLAGAVQRHAAQTHGAFTRPLEPCANGDQGGLAAARWPHDRAGTALFDRERNVAQDMDNVLAALKNFTQMLYA